MFNDKYAVIDFENLIKDIDLDVIIETGTKVGESTIKLKKYCKFIHTIEKKERFSKMAQENFNEVWPKDKNIKFWIGDTRDKLTEVLNTITKNENVLLFLDAHTHMNGYEDRFQDNPLKEELFQIENFIKMKSLKEPYIVIDDFANPKNEKIKHNIYGDTALNIQYVKKQLDLIYEKNGYEVYYTEKVENLNHSGKAFIKPKRIEEM